MAKKQTGTKQFTVTVQQTKTVVSTMELEIVAASENEAEEKALAKAAKITDGDMWTVESEDEDDLSVILCEEADS